MCNASVLLSRWQAFDNRTHSNLQFLLWTKIIMYYEQSIQDNYNVRINESAHTAQFWLRRGAFKSYSKLD